MSNSTKGFASRSKQSRREVSREGGKASAEAFKRTGKGHQWSPEEARRIGQASSAKALRKRAIEAALNLLGAGYTPQELVDAQLSDSEYIKCAKQPQAESTIRRIRGSR